MTKEEKLEYQRAWHREYYRKYRSEHREEFNAYHRAYYAANKERILAARKRKTEGDGYGEAADRQ